MIPLNTKQGVPAILPWYWLFMNGISFLLPSLLFFILIGFISKAVGFMDIWSWVCFFIALMFLFLLLAFIMQLIRYLFFSYLITQHEITISWGIINRHSVAVRFEEIQNTRIEMSLSKRIFGLADILIWTAADDQATGDTAKPDITMILTEANANWLKDFMLNQ
jgi:uncharacterized membrane protein YdbT with pleckstrin-like domain